tara:strand:- start:1239 stop:3143 length:1905 start_codon:yes stop_codon:yes gene_type:complete
MAEYEDFIALSRYARWIGDRRETWEETVDRYMENIVDPVLEKADDTPIATPIRSLLRNAILNKEVMPSMRAMMTAGEASRRDNTCMYNCYYAAIKSIRSFSDAFFVLLCGTGVGFSVERQFINQLPKVSEQRGLGGSLILVRDSKEGWQTAFNKLLEQLYAGLEVTYDLSLVRRAGARLKTFGGRASGPGPLSMLFDYTIDLFSKAGGRRLTSIECNDLVCKAGEAVVVGGVRRAACISLSNLSDDRMRTAKSGQWYLNNPERAMANNSAVYTDRPPAELFMKEWLSLIESKSGERGIFNRQACVDKVKENGRRDPNHEFGTNPCSEIILRDGQFCNLTEVVVRHDDDYKALKRKVGIAAILGTIQATYTHFPSLPQSVTDNCVEEALLGVSMTGIFDNTLTANSSNSTAGMLQDLREYAVTTNKYWASRFNINQAAAITCVKPSGTVSQLVDSASGIHPRYAEYYIRTVRGDTKDPLTQFMIDAGFPYEPCVSRPASTVVFSFPKKAPGKIIGEDMTAIEHLELWLNYATNWCEHKPSITVSVKDHEWVEVGAFVYEHFDRMSGVSFLPHTDHTYEQAPYQRVDIAEYETMLNDMPTNVDWSKLNEYEKEDGTSGSSTFACSGDVCEIVDIGA